MAVLLAAWAAVGAAGGRLTFERLTLLGAGGIAILLAGALTSTALWTAWTSRRDRIVGSRTRVAIALAPWLGLLALVAARGLWWTQRPSALRFFVVALLINWTLGWIVRSVERGVPPDAMSRPALVPAVLFSLLGWQGLAFGLTPFGCGVSALVAALGAAGLVCALAGTRTARMGLIAASAATVCTCMALEAVVRVAHIGANLRESDSRELARQFYTLTPPGSAFVVQPTALDEFAPALIDINSLGIRGPEIPDGRADVLLIGDSFVEARQLPWDRTVTPQLQDAFARRSIPARVAGHGMRGWSPLLEWNWYLKVGRTLKPRDVLLFFFWNDLWTEGDEVQTFQAVMDRDGRPDHFDVLVEPDWIWYQHVRMLRVIDAAWRAASFSNLRRSIASMQGAGADSGSDDGAREQMAKSQADGPPLTSDELTAVLTQPQDRLSPALAAVARSRFWPGMRPLPLWTAAQLDAAARTEDKLRRFAEDVAADGARLTIVYVPNPLQVGRRECSVGRFFDRVDRGVLLPPDSGVQEWLRGVSARQRIELIDPSGAMRAADDASGGEPPLYLRADCHWSDAGHAFIANVVADWYAERLRTDTPSRR